MTPLVSIIVPIRNEAQHIRGTLQCLKRQTYEHFQVLVIDGNSEDETVSIVRDIQSSFPELELLFNPDRSSSTGRNIGIRHALGKYIVVIDGHCSIEDDDHLQKLVDLFEQSGADSLGRPQPLEIAESSRFQQSVWLARKSWLGHNPDSAAFSDRTCFLPAKNVAVAYRREVFLKIGLFDERFDACEDVEFNTRLDQAGMRCFFSSAIRVFYHPRSSLRGLFRQMYRYGQGRARLGWKNPSSRTNASRVPAWGLIWLQLLLVSSLVSTTAQWMVVLSVAVYGIVLILESARLACGQHISHVLQIPFLLMAIHLGFGWGYLRESLQTMKVIPSRLIRKNLNGKFPVFRAW